MTALNGPDIAAAGLDDWAYLLRGLQTRFLTGDFATGLRLLERIGAAAEEADHHPDLDLRYAHLGIRLTSHDVGRVTERDVDLARRISAMAAEEGVAAAPQLAQRVEIGLDTLEADAVRPFWRAALAMDDGPDGDLVDPVLPALWFQPSGSEEPRQRFHLDLWVDPAVVEERISAAVAAGGELVSDEEAPRFWVLADPEGNKVCLCTWQERSH